MVASDTEKPSITTNFYHFHQYDGEGVISGICTLNTDNLGNEPILITDKEELPMFFNGKYYSAAIKYPTHQYRIYYKDTDKYENQGNPISLDKHKISRDILVKDLINSGKPLQKDISKGFAEGKVVTDIKSITDEESVILVLNDAGDGDEVVELPSNVRAIVAADGRIDYLSHIAALSRSYYNLFTILYDEKKFAELKSLNGEYIYISNLDGELSYHKISQLQKVFSSSVIRIPKLSQNAEFYDYNEITGQNSGMKALRIANLQSMAVKSQLEDILIPKGFVVSAGYVDKIEEYLNTSLTQEEREDRLFENPFLKELEEKCHNIGIEPQNSIIRSAFNAEDLYEYPTAGLYESECCYGINDFVLVIDNIYTSKDSPKAVESRNRYGIPDEIMQLSVIIQEYISSDYKFTAYTDLVNNKVLIEISASEYANINLESATIIYDDISGELTVKRHQIYNNKFLIDANGNILEKIDGHNPIADAWNILQPLLIKVSKNALVLEKTFGKPQDIEGGIKGEKIYFWQIRDIVKNTLERI